MDGVELEFTEGALHKVVDLTVKKGTGARGRRSGLEQAMMDIMYDIPSQSNITKFEITAEVIEKGVDKIDDEDELERKRA